jgi:hypothetical protein
MSNQVGRKKKLVLAASAVVLLVGLVAAPTFAAAQKTIRLDIIGPAANQGTSPAVLSVAPSNTVGNVFAVKVTNTTPGSSNPNSFTVTVPSTPTTSNPNSGTGFQITNVAYVPTSCSPDCGAFGVGSTNANLGARFNWTGTTLSATGIDPMKQSQFVILKVTVATPSIATCPSEGPFAWSATGWTGTNGTNSGQPFSLTAGDGKSTLLTKTCPAAPTIKIDNTTPVGDLAPLSTRTYTVIGSEITFYAAATGNPLPDITWQSSANNSTWTNISTTTDCPNPVALASASCKFTTVVGSDGTYYRAKANNGVPDASNDVSSNVIQIAYTAPCGTTIPESGGGTTAKVTLVKNPATATGCTPKALSLAVAQTSVTVIPLGGTCVSIATCATYVVETAWDPELAALTPPVPATTVSPTGNPPSTTGSEPEVWCTGTYDPSKLPTILDLETGNGGTYGMSMPAGHQWCLIQQISSPAGVGSVEPLIGPLIRVTEFHLLLGDAVACRKCG